MATKKRVENEPSSLLQDRVFRAAVEHAFNHIIITDVDGIILFANAGAERMTGYSRKEMIGQNPRLWGGQMERVVYEKMWEILKKEKRVFHGEFNNRRKNGDHYIAKVVISPILNAEGELQGFIGTEEDVTKEREAERMKSEFVSITSHQLLTPLTGMRWALDLLEKNTADMNDDQIALLSSIDTMNERLIRLVTLLLNIAIIESGTFAPKKVHCNVRTILEEVVASLAQHAQKYGVTVSLRSRQTATTLGDPHLLAEAIGNILSNAIKYSGKGKSVAVILEVKNGGTILEIKDCGMGILKVLQGQ
jgi:PAS domain S-box-containing protein